MLRMDVAERRRRLAARHALAPAHRVAGAVEAARSVVCLHATDPATVYLSVGARTDGCDRAGVDAALYERRTLVKHMAMRRTLWVVPREALPAVQGAASERVAGAERRRLVRDVERAGLHADGERWLDAARAAVCAALAGREATSAQLREELPELRGAVTYGEGRTWGADVPIGPRVLTVLAAEGRIVRASNDGDWYVSRPRWTAAADWLGEPVTGLEEATATAALARLWLQAFGPGTATDLKWWLGGTVRAVRRALADVDAVAVDLGGATGWVLPGDTEPAPDPGPWVALLPGLDPTTMGWKERDWYLGPHGAELFDTMGNAGPTAWCDGRIVGGWRQAETGEVDVQLVEDVGAEAREALATEAGRLTRWCGGRRVLPRFPSPLSRRAA